MGQTLTFKNTVFKQEGNNGLGEWRAHFVTGVDEQNLSGAFGSAAAKGSLKTMGGVVQLNEKQLEARIGELKAEGGHEKVISELEKGQKAVEARVANALAAKGPKKATATAFTATA